MVRIVVIPLETGSSVMKSMEMCDHLGMDSGCRRLDGGSWDGLFLTQMEQVRTRSFISL